ncbi:MAG: hypothetical protein ABS59_07030 [Methylobacterium sp. SCN 67-24]|nr:MAG: hypothetical protein ABS59_07030 [Methylobacterium sp. SCN 67-24]
MIFCAQILEALGRKFGVPTETSASRAGQHPLAGRQPAHLLLHRRDRAVCDRLDDLLLDLVAIAQPATGLAGLHALPLAAIRLLAKVLQGEGVRRALQVDMQWEEWSIADV